MNSSRSKGKRGELEFRRELMGYLADLNDPRVLERNLTQTRGGGGDFVNLRPWCIEVKRANPRWYEPGPWWAQAAEQARAAGNGAVPVLAFRLDRQDWRVRVPLRLFVEGAPDTEVCDLSLFGFALMVHELEYKANDCR